MPEEEEPPIYAEADKVEFKKGVTVAKSPYSKIFDVSSFIEATYLETN